MRITLSILLLLLLCPHGLPAQQQLVTSDVQAAMERLSADSLLRHARILAGDAFEGRGTGTRGEHEAARYIARELARFGVLPMGGDSTFLQQFPLHASRPLAESRLRLRVDGAPHELTLWDDYLLYKTGAQTFIPQPLRMVFVGYGIVAPEFDYNDYLNINVENAVVVFLSGEPQSDDPGYFNGSWPSIHSIPEMKQRVALARGARGSITIPLPREEQGFTWEDWRRIFSFEDVRLPITVPGHLSVLLRLERCPLLFAGSRYSLQDVLEMDSLGTVRSFTLDTQICFSGVFRQRDFLAANVVGMLEGRDPLLRDSYVVCSAHYDHLGIGPAADGDSIYNGFVDNALGTAAVLELARVLSAGDVTLRRSIIFLLVTGEEKGLLGSQYYCSNPVVPLHRTVANLNIDGLAIIDTFDDVVGVGGDFSTLQTHLLRIAYELDMSVSDLPPEVDIQDAFSRSDQIAFAQVGIPSILVMEGTQYRNLPPGEGFARFIEWGRRHYHMPSDDPDQPVDDAAVQQHAAVLLAYLAGLANTYEPPQWVTGARYINARLQSLAEER